jgi:uncharacterized protein YlxP (DUF503 family)
LSIELHLPEVRSLKAKRATIKPIIEGARHRFRIAVAEVDHQDQWQRCSIGVAVVAASEAHVCDILDEVERFVWSFPDMEVIDMRRSWLEEDT